MESILFLGLNLYAWIVIVTILTMFTILTFTKLPADVVFMGGMAVLFVSGYCLPKKHWPDSVRSRWSRSGCCLLLWRD